MRDPAYLNFPSVVIGDTYGPLYLRPYKSNDGSVYPAGTVRLRCEVRTDTIQNNGLLLLTLCDGFPTQTPPNMPNPSGFWFWVLSANASQTASLTPGVYPADITVIFPDDTRRTIVQGSLTVKGGYNG